MAFTGRAGIAIVTHPNFFMYYLVQIIDCRYTAKNIDFYQGFPLNSSAVEPIMNQLVHKSNAPARRGRPRKAASPGNAPAFSGKRPAATVRERTQDPEAVRADILQAAIAEFGEKGLAGARVDDIAAATRTSKRMIYYYFGSKDGLYLSALEASYRRVRQIEIGMHLDEMPPLDALRCLVTVTFDHHLHNEHYIRMVMSENINRGRYLAQSPHIRELNRPAIELIRHIYERGVAQGVFRSGLDPADIHASISALAFFNVSNRHTFGLIFQIDNQSPAYIANRRENIVQMVLRYVQTCPSVQAS